MEWILCRVVESSCFLTRNIAPHISLHDPPYHKTMKKYEDFEGMEAFLFTPRKFAIRTWFCNCLQYPCLFDILVEYNPNRHGQGMMSVFPSQPLCLVLSTSDQDFVSFQPIWCHPHTQIRTILFSRCTNKHSQWETFSQPYFNRIFSNCLFHNSPANGWSYRFRSRGTTGSSMLDHDFGHLCFGRRI